MSLNLARLVAVTAALSVSACATVPFSPPLGDSAAQVLERRGQPAEVFAAPATFDFTHEEYRYGEVYVGMISRQRR